MRFSSSGREDIDVRMLGEGRPFVLEIVNPHRTKFSPEDYAKMQSEINAATHLVRVRDLQRINKYISAQHCANLRTYHHPFQGGHNQDSGRRRRG